MALMRDSSKSKNEERLQEVTVGELKPHNAPITLVDYDPKWPKLFDREAKRIYSILGKKVLQLEHVGSTSVPGLCALSQLLIFYWLSRILLTKGLTFLTWRRQATLYAFENLVGFNTDFLKALTQIFTYTCLVKDLLRMTECCDFAIG